MADLRIKVKIGEWPNEVPDPIRFGEDRTHAAYDPEYARRFWRILLQVDRAFKLFRTGFIGKCSPVHFFWVHPLNRGREKTRLMVGSCV